MQAQRIPGVSIAVMKDGKLVRARGYGFANLELSVPAAPETVYQSGSLGKQFTAMAVMMLVEEGKLALDDPIARFIPDAPPAWQSMRVRHLLTHTSGMGDYTEKIDLRKDVSEDELVKFAEAQPLEFAPGEKWSYSNSAYMVLGHVIRKASGQFYGDLLRDRVFRPLGMETRVISEADLVPNRAAGYRLVDGVLKNQEWVAPSINTTADGALYFTVLDLAKWDAALYTEKLVKQASLAQIWTPVRLNDGSVYRDKEGSGYGFGWDIATRSGHRVVEHGGSWQGFQSYIFRDLDDRLTVVALSNLGGSKPVRIAHGIAERAQPR
jgi:CubicO group peptidase (beta-lactamase class C family)